MGKEGKREIWTSLGNLGQVWAIQGKLGQGNNLEKWGEKAERIRKGEKNLSGDGEEEEGGGESRVQNSPKAFGELKMKKKFNRIDRRLFTIGADTVVDLL